MVSVRLDDPIQPRATPQDPNLTGHRTEPYPAFSGGGGVGRGAAVGATPLGGF